MTIAVDNHVFLPNALVGRFGGATAVGRFKVAEVGAAADADHQRSLRVVLSANEDADDGWVAKSKVHEDLAIVLIRFGDFGSEAGLLDPLAKSLSHFFRLLVGDDYFRIAYLRTRVELARFMATQSGTTHLVLVAHGRRNAVKLVGADEADGFEDWMQGGTLGQLLVNSHVLSLACHTGYAAFSSTLSATQGVRSCGAPLNEVHGAVASQFTQTVFAEHLLHGRTWPMAFRLARGRTTGTSAFRLWVDGSLSQGVTV